MAQTDVLLVFLYMHFYAHSTCRFFFISVVVLRNSFMTTHVFLTNS